MPTFCFLTHVHNEKSLALLNRNALGWLYYHPDTKLLIVTDGIHIPSSPLIGHVQVFNGDALKQPPYIPWLSRAFYVFNHHSDAADYMIRLDPDTVCHRPICQFPSADMFGTRLFSHNCSAHIQGGCVGFSRRLTEQFYTQPLEASKVIPPKGSPNEHYSDLVLYDIVRNQLKLPIANWEEVNCHPIKAPTFKQPISPWAFTHPHKEI